MQDNCISVPKEKTRLVESFHSRDLSFLTKVTWYGFLILCTMIINYFQNPSWGGTDINYVLLKTYMQIHKESAKELKAKFNKWGSSSGYTETQICVSLCKTSSLCTCVCNQRSIICNTALLKNFALCFSQQGEFKSRPRCAQPGTSPSDT